MFKQLRNRMLMLNMVLISALLIASFVTIYLVNRSSTYRSIDGMLSGPISAMHREPPPNITENMPSEQKKKAFFKHNAYSKRDPVIYLLADTDGGIITSNSPFSNMDDIDIETITENIILKENDKGNIKHNGTKWYYKKIIVPNGNYAISFGEFSAERKMLFDLIITLAAVGALALAFSFFISLMIAKRCIKPIEESYNKQKQFVADASHELKTPLTVINTNIDVLLSHTSCINDDGEKWLMYIKDEAQRMTKLTNDLLYLARLDHDTEIIYSKVSFSSAAESVLLTMDAAAFEQSVQINSEIAENIFTVGSEEHLKQIVMILIDNALKYTNSGGIIDVKLSDDGLLSIKNYGIGISEKDKKHIFERFYRTDESRSRDSGGYGLGLAIAKALAKSMKGTITVNSDGKSYTEFIVKIPVLKE